MWTARRLLSSSKFSAAALGTGAAYVAAPISPPVSLTEMKTFREVASSKLATLRCLMTSRGPLRTFPGFLRVSWPCSSTCVRCAGSGKEAVSSALARPMADSAWWPFWRSVAPLIAGLTVFITFADSIVTNVFHPGVCYAAGFALLATGLDRIAQQYFAAGARVPCQEVSFEEGCASIKTSQADAFASAEPNVQIQWSCSSMRGWRQTMEDSHIATIIEHDGGEIGLFAVFDGHGGWEVSAIAAAYFPWLLRARLHAAKQHAEPDMPGMLAETVEALDAKLRSGPMHAAHLLPQSMHPFRLVGSTACIAVLDAAHRQVVVSNTGDSRAIICRNGMAISLSEDHKPEDAEELSRIVKAGGRVLRMGPCYRVDGALNLSRALGDFRYKDNKLLPPVEQKVIATPSTKVHNWRPELGDEFLVVACDGLFERMDRQDVVDTVRRGLAQGVAPKQVLHDLLRACCARWPMEAGQDNETVVLVQWAQPAEP